MTSFRINGVDAASLPSRKRIPGSVHVVFGSECNNAMDWKSIGVFHSFETSGWKRSGSTSKITRLLACSEEQLQNYRGLNIGPTFVHPNYKYEPGYGLDDEYSPTYNKPASLVHFTSEVAIEEEFILFIDADMLLRRVLHPSDYDARKGLVLSEWVWYIQQGIKNGMAHQFLPPDIAARSSTTHGGYFHLFHVDDAKAVSPRWLHYTKEVRQHPEKYWASHPDSTLIDNIDTEQKGAVEGKAPWISEMYGYAFAAAELGLEHLFARGGGGVLYGDDFLSVRHPGPYLSHYTLSCRIPSQFAHVPPERDVMRVQDVFFFDKNDFSDLDPHDCDRREGSFLPSPPNPDRDHIPYDEGSGLCAENVRRLNDALCSHYRNTCPLHSPVHNAVLDHCPWDMNRPTDHRWFLKPAACGDNIDQEECLSDKRHGRCKEDPAYMQLNCLETCGFCAQHDQRWGGGGGGAGKKVCNDKAGLEECQILAERYECLLNPTWMMANCQSTCGGCDGSSAHPPHKYTSIDNTRQMQDSMHSSQDGSILTNYANELTVPLLAILLFVLVMKSAAFGSTKPRNKNE